MKKNYVKKCLALTLAFSMTFSTVALADTAKDTYMKSGKTLWLVYR